MADQFFGELKIIIFGLSFPGGSDREESAHNVGDLGLTPGSGRSHGEGNGYPLQYSFLENSMDRGAWGCKESDTTEQLTCLCLAKVYKSEMETWSIMT